MHTRARAFRYQIQRSVTHAHQQQLFMTCLRNGRKTSSPPQVAIQSVSAALGTPWKTLDRTSRTTPENNARARHWKIERGRISTRQVQVHIWRRILTRERTTESEKKSPEEMWQFDCWIGRNCSQGDTIFCLETVNALKLFALLILFGQCPLHNGNVHIRIYCAAKLRTHFLCG